MKSIKPGRGPSMMGGFASIFVAIFGVIWTIAAASMGAGIFALFGLVFIGFAVVQAIYNFKNATGKNRYSAFDIVDGTEEPDPLNERFGGQRPAQPQGTPGNTSQFCPYCGKPVTQDFEFCPGCGKELP